MSDTPNPFDPPRARFPWQEEASEDVWDDPEPSVPLTPPPAGLGAPGQVPAGYQPPMTPPSYPAPADKAARPAAAPGQQAYAVPSYPSAPASPSPGGYARPGGPDGSTPLGYGYLPQQASAGSKGLAITALVLAIIGAVTSLAFIGVPLAIVALILGIVALARRANGKGMSIAAVIVSSISLLWGIFVVLMLVFVGSLASGLGYVDAAARSSYYETYADDTEVAAMQSDVSLAEYAVSGRSAIPQYLVLVENANPDTRDPDSTITVTAIDASGEIIDTRTEFGDIYPGTNAFAGDFVVASDLIDNITIDVDGIVMQKPVDMPGGNPLEATGFEVNIDRAGAHAEGTIENSSSETLSSVEVLVVERDGAGEIVSYGQTHISTIPARGSAPFTATFPASDTADSLTHEVYALAAY